MKSVIPNHMSDVMLVRFIAD